MSDDAPDGWHWGIGNRSTSYYTYWLYTDDVDGYECEVYWDDGSDHTVNFYETYGVDEDGDTIVDEYPTKHRSFDSEEKAIEWALAEARKLQ